MFKLATALFFFGSAKLGCIGDRDIYLDQSSTAFLFILHLFWRISGGPTSVSVLDSGVASTSH